MKEMSVSSDKEEENFIDLEEILQLQQDLNLPALDLTNDTQKYQHNRQYEVLAALQQQHISGVTNDTKMEDTHWSNEEQGSH